MNALLLADLRAFVNLFATHLGRRLTLGTGIGLVLLGTLSWWFATAVLERPYLLATIEQSSGGAAHHGLFGYGLMACPLVATWLGLALAQRQLFETPELALWRQAPVAAWRLPVQVLLRAVFLSVCQASALAGPFLVAVATQQRSDPAPAWALLLVPVAILGATAPLLAVLLAVQIVLVRCFAGRWLRLVLAITGALASVGFSAWLLLTLFAPAPERVQSVVAIAGQPARLPWTFATGAALLASASRGVLDHRALLGLLGWLAVTAIGFAVVARLHPGALERHLAAEPAPLLGRGRRWPASIPAVIRRKEFAQVLQQPGAMIGFLVFAVLVFALAKEQVLVGGLLGNQRLPRDVVHTAVMLAQWFLAVLLVLYAHMGRLVLQDGAQWSLYVAAPNAAFALLRGKLQAIFVYLMWPLGLVALAGAWLLPASQTTVLVYVGMALGGTASALGVLAVVGTLPMLVRPDDGGHIAQGGKGVFSALLLVMGFYLVTAPAVPAWLWLDTFAHRTPVRQADAVQWAPWAVAAALVYGLVIATLGITIGARNYRRLLAPR